MIEDIVLEFSDPSELVMETDRPFDLLDDTVSEATVLSGYRFHRPDGQVAYGECTYDCDTSAGTVEPGDIVFGKKAYSHGREVVGTHQIKVSKLTNIQRTSNYHTVRAATYAPGASLFNINLSELLPSGSKDIYLQTNQLSLSQVVGTTDINKNQISWVPVMSSDDQTKIAFIVIKTVSMTQIQRTIAFGIKFNITTAYIAT